MCCFGSDAVAFQRIFENFHTSWLAVCASPPLSEAVCFQQQREDLCLNQALKLSFQTHTHGHTVVLSACSGGRNKAPCLPAAQLEPAAERVRSPGQDEVSVSGAGAPYPTSSLFLFYLQTADYFCSLLCQATSLFLIFPFPPKICYNCMTEVSFLRAV